MNTSTRVSTDEAADALGIASRSLRRWARAGKIAPAWRTPGRRYVWDLDDLRAQLTGHDLADEGEQWQLSDTTSDHLRTALQSLDRDRKVLREDYMDSPPDWQASEDGRAVWNWLAQLDSLARSMRDARYDRELPPRP